MMASRRKGRKTNKSKVNKVEEGEPVTKHNPCAFFDAGEVAQIKGVLRIKEAVSVNSPSSVTGNIKLLITRRTSL